VPDQLRSQGQGYQPVNQTQRPAQQHQSGKSVQDRQRHGDLEGNFVFHQTLKNIEQGNISFRDGFVQPVLFQKFIVFRMTDKGQVTIENIDGSNGRMEAYRTHYRWDLGLTVRDWRYVVRIANIDRSNLTADAATGANLPELMFEATELVPNLNAGRAAFYMSRSLRTKLRQQTANAVTSSTLTIDMVGGVRVMDFDGIPVRRVDALAADEARIV